MPERLAKPSRIVTVQAWPAPWAALAAAVTTLALAVLVPLNAQATTSDDAGVQRFMQADHAMMRDGRKARGIAEGQANIRAWQELQRKEQAGAGASSYWGIHRGQ